ncbi:MAG: inositol monophosphatase family protein, partial [Alphaproteobacteria bacterium]
MDPRDLDRRAEALTALVREVGALAREAHARRHAIDVRDKGGADFVTEADLAVQARLYRELAARFRDDAFFGEESAEPAVDPARPTWVIDPIDGTSNFAHGRPGWCVSVALRHRGESVLGAVYDPLQDELFSARRGAGAYLGDARLACREHGAVAGAQLVFGLTRKAPPQATLAAVERLALEGASFRSYGVGALMIAYVGAGRIDGFFEAAIFAWDAAAATLIAEEAGAIVSPLARSAADRAPFPV